MEKAAILGLLLAALPCFAGVLCDTATGGAQSHAGAAGQDNPLKIIEIGNSAYCESRMRDALAAYRHAVALAPDSTDAVRGEIRSLLALDMTRDAYPRVLALLSRSPQDRTARLFFAQSLMGLRAFSEADEALQKLKSEDERDAEAWYFFGKFKYQNGYYAAALAAFDHLVSGGLAPQLDPPADRERLRVYRAISMAQTGRGNEAESEFEKLAASPLAVADPDFLLSYARLLLETGRAEAALIQVNRALAENPTTMGYFWRARVEMHLGKNRQALDDAEQAVALAPQLPFARTLLVRLYQMEGRAADSSQQAEWLRHFEARANHLEGQ